MNRLTFYCALLLFMLSTAGCHDTRDRSGLRHFSEAFYPWSTRWNASMTREQADEAARVFWAGSGGRLEVACHLAALGVKESSLSVRKWQPWVKQNKDYLGAHNEVLLCELRAQGWLDRYVRPGCRARGPDCWTDEAKDWLAFLSKNPEIGTLLASLWFCRLLHADGGDLLRTTQRWKVGGAAFVDPEKIKDPKRRRRAYTIIVQALEYAQHAQALAAGLRAEVLTVQFKNENAVPPSKAGHTRRTL